MKEIDDIRTLLNLMNDSIADEIRRLLTSLEAKMSEPHVTIRMMDSDEVQRALNGAPIQTDLPSFIRGRLQELTNRLNSVTRDLNATRLQAEARQKRIIKLEERIKFGDQWETELRNALGIAGLHVEGARILDRVREVMSMRMITSTGQRLRDEERERIFRKLTSIDAVTRSLSFDQIGWRFISGAISYSITYTKQQMSDFLKED